MQLSSKNKIIPILMCGGSGTRLWPMSRKSLPKQFLKCNPNSNKSFLQEAILRLKDIKRIESPILICNQDHRFIAAEQMREIETKPLSIILEPVGKNTAPTIALGTIKAKSIEKESILLILPADQTIKNEDEFIKTIEKGIEYAEKGNIVTFGISPTSPETGFGYIEAENLLGFKNGEGSPIKRFIEKPTKEKAEELIAGGQYSWNSGIFLMKANVAFNQMLKFCPDILYACEKSLEKCFVDLDFLRINENLFKKCRDVSFDVAIMEKTILGFVFLLDIEWSDVGSWDSIWKISEKDSFGNSLIGNVFNQNTKNCYLRSESRLVVGSEIENLIVVETSDAVMVTKKDASQKVKDIVELLKIKNYNEAFSHKQVYRPWGSYLAIADGSNWQVKRINVNPGASLSLQKHNFRTEHWIIVSGVASVEIGDEKKILKKNESTYIPLGIRHRLSNPGEKILILIEVQSGSYLGEDDIFRYEDDYGRKDEV
tara:strand:+ start:5575 stop:7029 length:1455 start_codon:yes stop_codon:yes gene_type:complete